ncbi:MAG TPA: hypothetical protein VJJ83_05375 [Candidatus Babeliales bacterium]|nr:MAG: hypothetical protein A3F67_01065 [Verrucomicrobia bacterium RIFCSPHIGHO2_12_FULL_41_10]HLB41196.1 hypothetical protein [Candidatus Babeliales bacterium]
MKQCLLALIVVFNVTYLLADVPKQVGNQRAKIVAKPVLQANQPPAKLAPRSAKPSGVSYKPNCGRLGDQLICYMHAKWVAYKYNLQLYYKPFIYSDQLVLDGVDQRYQEVLTRFLQPKPLLPGQSLEALLADGDKGMLYEIPYFPESVEELKTTVAPDSYDKFKRSTNIFAYFPVDWSDRKFKKLLQKLIAPKQPLNLVPLPKNKLTIALQVRKNSGGFDLPLLSDTPPAKFNPNQVYVDVVFPLKHPPESYYIEQLQVAIKLFAGQPIYVYMFTDDPAPLPILERIKQAINDPKVEFACRTTENNHYSNVLEDLFSMTKFDCLIRPDSNISIVASKLGDFKLVISPAHHHWEERKLVIDEVNLQMY